MFLKFAVLFCILVIVTSERVNPLLSNVKELSRKRRMIGGNEAQPHEFPYIVSIGDSHRCGGAILNENWVITAGHCPDIFLIVKAGKHSLNTVENTEQAVDIEKYFVHKEYNRGVGPHDIALLKLKKPLIYNEYVKPIALPKNDEEFSGQVILSGWGYMENNIIPKKLRKVEMNIIDFDSCQMADIAASMNYPSDVTRTNLCTGSEPNGVFGCKLDSGSPLVKQQGDNVILVGIFSWLINPCGQPGAPSVFTKVSSYIDWIEDIINTN